jgi:hypothetical protein
MNVVSRYSDRTLPRYSRERPDVAARCSQVHKKRVAQGVVHGGANRFGGTLSLASIRYAKPRYQPNELAPCRSPSWGCDDAEGGKRICPHKCKEEYREWLGRWEPKGDHRSLLIMQ